MGRGIERRFATLDKKYDGFQRDFRIWEEIDPESRETIMKRLERFERARAKADMTQTEEDKAEAVAALEDAFRAAEYAKRLLNTKPPAGADAVAFGAAFSRIKSIQARGVELAAKTWALLPLLWGEERTRLFEALESAELAVRRSWNGILFPEEFPTEEDTAAIDAAAKAVARLSHLLERQGQ